MWRAIAALLLTAVLVCFAQAQSPVQQLLLFTGSKLDPNAVTWCATVGCGASQKTAVSKLIAGLKTDGLWTTFDRIWLFDADTTAQTQTDLVNLQQWSINTGSQSLTSQGTKMSSGGVIDAGFATNGLTNFTQNNLQVSAYVTVADSGCSGDCFAVGIHDTSSIFIGMFVRSGALRTLMSANCVYNDTPGAFTRNNNGFWVSTRNGSSAGNDTYYYYDATTGAAGTSTSNCGDASQTMGTRHPYLFALNDQGSAIQTSQMTLGVMTFGSAWSSTQATNAAARFNTYETGRGNNLW